MMRIRLLLAATLAALSMQAHAEAARIAIIIDDIGYERDAGQRALALPGPVTYAVLPGAPRASQMAIAAHDDGKEVLVHLPMEAAAGGGNAEPDQITIDTSQARFAATLEAALATVPHAIGINNHRGSLLTQHPGHMQWLMEAILEYDGLFFVDSYTTHRSVALQIAAENGVPAIRRDVFLDADQSTEAVEREFLRLKDLARQRGAAVGIAHPYDVTLEVLERVLPLLGEEGYELVPISELVLGDRL